MNSRNVCPTYFAPAERAEPEELQKMIRFASHNPIIDSILASGGGLIAVLNTKRQIIAINNAFLNMLGVDDTIQVLGHRPGEAISCIHAHEMPGGCGTTEYCASCGAAIAIVASLTKNEPVERKCVAELKINGELKSMCFHVRSCPVKFEGQNLVLLFFNDITRTEQWAALERAFLHDINNIITALAGNCELQLLDGGSGNTSVETIARLSTRLAKEVELQRILVQSKAETYRPVFQKTPLMSIFKELEQIFINHPVRIGKKLILPESVPHDMITTDRSVLIRILVNMIKNAFEASPEGSEITLRIAATNNSVKFAVHNPGTIPPHIAKRIFQKHFSTKKSPGSGIGTFVMKHFGETVLNGRVEFESTQADGTTFRLTLPPGCA